MNKAVIIFTTVALLCLLTGPAFAESPSQSSQEDNQFDVYSEDEITQPQLAGQMWRWTVPYFRSIEAAQGNSGTVVQLVNTSGATCDVTVEWLRQNSVVCTSTATLTGKSSFALANICSRDMRGAGFQNEDCGIICNPALDFDQGWMKIFVTDDDACEKILLDVRVHYTEADDSAIRATGNQKVIKKKTQKGD